MRALWVFVFLVIVGAAIAQGGHEGHEGHGHMRLKRQFGFDPFMMGGMFDPYMMGGFGGWGWGR